MKYKYWWMCLQGLSNRTKRNLLERYKSAHAIYDLSEKCLRQDGLLDARQADIFLRERKKADLDTAYQTFLQTGASFVTLEDTEYPYYLKEVFDAPYGMYVKGQIPQTKKIVAIVGARRCSAYGKKMAQELAYLLGKQGYVVISGMARGIDAYAHEGCLQAGQKTMAVFGCGVDVCYPTENRSLYGRIMENGAFCRNMPWAAADRQAVPAAQPPDQWNRKICGRCRGKGKERVFDHDGFCLGTGKGYLCDPRADHGCHECWMQPSDRTGSGDHHLAEWLY